jgi:cytochrome c
MLGRSFAECGNGDDGSISFILTALLLRPDLVWAAGDATRGEALARVWRTDCYTVESNGKDITPPLAEIARQGAPDEAHARAFLTAPHPPMPNFDLARSQIDDIVAYLKSLAPR